MKQVIDEIKSELTKDKLIITVAAGISIGNMEEWLGNDFKIIRTMPNTPALVGQAMSAVCPNKNISKEELEYVLKYLKVLENVKFRRKRFSCIY